MCPVLHVRPSHPVATEVHLHSFLEHHLSVFPVPNPSAVASHGHAVFFNAGPGFAAVGVEFALESDVTLFSFEGGGQTRESEVQALWVR